MLLRTQGKLAFATMRDASGEIQLFALEPVSEQFDEFVKLHLGDWGRRHRRSGAHQARRALGQGRLVGSTGRGATQLRRQVGPASPTSTCATVTARPTCGPTPPPVSRSPGAAP